MFVFCASVFVEVVVRVPVCMIRPVYVCEYVCMC